MGSKEHHTAAPSLLQLVNEVKSNPPWRSDDSSTSVSEVRLLKKWCNYSSDGNWHEFNRMCSARGLSETDIVSVVKNVSRQAIVCPRLDTLYVPVFDFFFSSFPVEAVDKHFRTRASKSVQSAPYWALQDSSTSAPRELAEADGVFRNLLKLLAECRSGDRDSKSSYQSLASRQISEILQIQARANLRQVVAAIPALKAGKNLGFEEDTIQNMEVDLSLSDPGQDGLMAFRLRNGVASYHIKPRSSQLSEICRRFFDLINYHANEQLLQCATEHEYSNSTISYTIETTQGYTNSVSIDSLSSRQKYRYGALLAASSILGISDLHAENVLWADGFPTPVDMETALNPVFDAERDEGRKVLLTAILVTGLISPPIRALQENIALDIAPVDLFSSNDRVIISELLEVPDSKVQHLRSGLSAVERGFQRVLKTIRDEADEFVELIEAGIGTQGPLSRVIFRPTYVYNQLLQSSLVTAISKEDCSFAEATMSFERLFKSKSSDRYFMDLLELEISALNRFEVPKLYCQVGYRELSLANDRQIRVSVPGMLDGVAAFQRRMQFVNQASKTDIGDLFREAVNVGFDKLEASVRHL